MWRTLTLSGLLVLLCSGVEAQVHFRDVRFSPDPGVQFSAAAGDFDGDGLSELASLVSVGLFQTDIRIYRQEAPGRFTPVTTLDVSPGELFHLHTADFTNDGHLDLIADCNDLDEFVVVPGLGDGQFGAPVVTPSARLVDHLMIADLDQDGNMDAVTITDFPAGQGQQDTVNIHLGDGQGRFAAPDEYAGGPNDFRPAAGDFNEDGQLDLVIPSGLSTVRLMFGPWGQGQATLQQFSPPRTVVGTPAVGDINRDGHLDLVFVVFTAGAAAQCDLFLGDGLGNFAFDRSLTAAGRGARSVFIVDADGDGFEDIGVSVDSISDKLVFFFGNGKGDFIGRTAFQTAASPGVLRPTDLDGNGLVDLTWLFFGGIQVALGTGGGRFEAIRMVDLPEVGERRLAVVDLEGDGHLDVLSPGSGNDVSVLRGEGDGTFGALPNLGFGGPPHSVTAGDFDGDTRLDVVVSEPSLDRVEVLLGDGMGGGMGSVASGAPSPETLKTGDFNEDGSLDVVAASPSENKIIVLPGDGTGGFLSPIEFSGLSFNPEIAAVADLNDDGHLDVIVRRVNSLCCPEFRLSILLGDGTGTLFLSQHVLEGGPVVVDDRDSDGIPELLVGVAGEVALLAQDESGLYERIDAFPIAFNRQFIAMHLADLDGDEEPDLFGVNAPQPFSFRLYVAVADGSGGFLPFEEFGHTGQIPEAGIASGDFDEDGGLDLILGSNEDVRIWLNRSRLINCLPGNVNAGAGSTTDVLFINDSAGVGPERQILTTRESPFEVRVDAPPAAAMAPFVLYVYTSLPDITTLFPVVRRVGVSCRPMPMHDPPPREGPVAILNNIQGFDDVLGQPTHPSSAAPDIPVDLQELGFRGTFYFQGLILDPVGRHGASVMNGVSVISR